MSRISQSFLTAFQSLLVACHSLHRSDVRHVVPQITRISLYGIKKNITPNGRKNLSSLLRTINGLSCLSGGGVGPLMADIPIISIV